MQSLIYYAVAFVDRIRALVGLVIPMFAEAADFRSWAPWVRVLVTCIVLGVIIAGLLILNDLPFVQRFLKIQANTAVQRFYLPLLFIVVCIFSWLAYYWWQLYNQNEQEEYPDIVAAWEDATLALSRDGISLGDLPVYLVLGRPIGGEETLFEAGKQTVTLYTTDEQAPIQVYANEQGIYVCTSGASTWGYFCQLLADPKYGLHEKEIGNTLAVGTIAVDILTPAGLDPQVLDRYYAYLRKTSAELTEDEAADLQELSELINSKGRSKRRLLVSQEEQTLGPRRLACVCRLITASRLPFLPINGVLVMVPWNTLETEDSSRTAISLLANDLASARNTLRLRYPHLVLVCDLELARGFERFRRGFNTQQLAGRIGQRLPLVPADRPIEEMPDVLAAAAESICQNTLPWHVIKSMQIEWPPDLRKTTNFVPSVNRELFDFVHNLFQRAPRLARLLASGMPIETESTDALGRLPLVAGCYLAATGNTAKQQAFVASVFQRLDETQSAVCWSDHAIEDNRMLMAWSRWMWILGTLIFAITVVALYQHYR
jgi:IcmF-related N-terminal domain